jgi:hypothetical protein
VNGWAVLAAVGFVGIVGEAVMLAIVVRELKRVRMRKRPLVAAKITKTGLQPDLRRRDRRALARQR